MKRLLFASFVLFAPVGTHAESAPPPEMQALQAVAMEAIQARLNWQTQAIALQAQIADLQKQLAAAKAQPQETPK